MISGRVLVPEMLDELAPDRPEAQRSRRDLQRVNVLMGQPSIMAHLLSNHRFSTMLDIGAGDGTFMLRVLERLPRQTGCLTLLDQQHLLTTERDAHFATFGWSCKAVAQDVFKYLGECTDSFDAITANLFLHHFEDERLAQLLCMIQLRTSLFVACEPRRSSLALVGSKGLGLVGCNHVTRHDAQVSVRAGFIDKEISALWPTESGWELDEHGVAPFSHAFKAVRKP